MEKILNEFKSLDKSILLLMKKGFKFCFKFFLFSALFLLLYKIIHIPNFFYIGLSLFKTNLFFLVAFITYGLIFNKIKNGLINF